MPPRARLKRLVGPLACAEAMSQRDGKRLMTAGLVLVRQKPGSAKGVMFATLEDRLGSSTQSFGPASTSARGGSSSRLRCWSSTEKSSGRAMSFTSWPNACLICRTCTASETRTANSLCRKQEATRLDGRSQVRNRLKENSPCQATRYIRKSSISARGIFTEPGRPPSAFGSSRVVSRNDCRSMTRTLREDFERQCQILCVLVIIR